jgi:hypothetical protein
MTFSITALRLFIAAVLLSAWIFSVEAQPVSNRSVSLGNRVEMFVDGWLIDTNRTRGISLKLNLPERREVVLTTDKPWEGKGSAYYSALQDGTRIRLYYRGFIPERGDGSDKQVTCMVESDDGIHFTRPNFGLFEFEGSKKNNIVYVGIEAHNFAPFIDFNPKAKPNARYKAVGGLASKLFGFVSPDGIQWKKIQAEPLMTKGAFDSLNVVFWDDNAKLYRCYSRYWGAGNYKGVRAVQSSTSKDFLHWSDPIPNRHHTSDGSKPPQEHFYTSATTPCPGAPHHLFSFPMRFVPERKKPSVIKDPGVSDAVFLSSRNGTDWDRTFLESWIRPGRDERNWTHRNNMPACGIVQTAPDEFSMYISEHYAWPDNRIRRITIRKYGFASMNTGVGGGEFTTRPITFSGKNLALNYATSAIGSVQVELQDEQGNPLPGFALSDMEPLFGDEMDAVVKWKSGNDLSAFIGKIVRLRFLLKDADLYSLRFFD